MKAFNSTFLSEAKQAITSPIRDMTQLCGGIDRKPLTKIQIKKLIAEQKAEKKRRREKKEWEDFLFNKDRTPYK